MWDELKKAIAQGAIQLLLLQIQQQADNRYTMIALETMLLATLSKYTVVATSCCILYDGLRHLLGTLVAH